MSKNKNPNCFKCKYFYITWDNKNPRGCFFYGFKSKALPSIVVLRSSGEKCQVFSPKTRD